MIYLNSDDLAFPAPHLARADGLLCLGGDLSKERLALAYKSGIFPWYEDGQPLLWWSPDPRMVLFPGEFKISKSFRTTLRNHSYTLTSDTAFEEVIRQCARIPRKDQLGTWITEEMIAAYLALHRAGMARSVELWEGSELAGGLYGIDLPEYGVFCGESMFSLRSNASKIALHGLVEAVQKAGYVFIDCQLYTDHLHSLGAREISRSVFLKQLDQPQKTFSAFSVSS